MTLLGARDGYRRWAPLYERETAISHLDAMLVDALTPPLAGLRLLDAGCGTGRRLADCGAASAVGIDASPEMLEAGIGIGQPFPHVRTLIGDVRAMPLPAAAFDVTWCRLVIGHLPECDATYDELARVTAPGGRVIVTDFHADAHAAGHRRTFRDAGGVHEVEHHVHTAERQVAAARAAGLELIDRRDATIGPDVMPFYRDAGRLSLYQKHVGLPVVLALAFRRAD